MYPTISEVTQELKSLGCGYDAASNIRPFTHREFYEISVKLGLNQDNPEYRRLFEHLTDWIKRTLNPRTAFEIGSGPGYLLNCLNEAGIDTRGIDGNPYSRDYFIEKHGKYAEKYVIDPVFSNQYPEIDLLISIEVFEHIEDPGLESVFRKIKEQLRPKFVVFSSTPFADPNPGWDIQWGHINLKPTEKWDELFAQNGYSKAHWIPPATQWSRLYVRSDCAQDKQYQHLFTEQLSWGKRLKNRLFKR